MTRKHRFVLPSRRSVGLIRRRESPNEVAAGPIYHAAINRPVTSARWGRGVLHEPCLLLYLFLVPDGNWNEPIKAPPYRLHRRLWEIPLWDLAALHVYHTLHLPYPVMDVMLLRCNMEVELEAQSLDESIEWLLALLLGLYVEGISPTFAPTYGAP